MLEKKTKSNFKFALSLTQNKAPREFILDVNIYSAVHDSKLRVDFQGSVSISYYTIRPEISSLTSFA